MQRIFLRLLSNHLLISAILILVSAGPCSEGAELLSAELSQQTVQDFEKYIQNREHGLKVRDREQNFLWCLEQVKRRQKIQSDGFVVEPFEGQALHPISDGLIHDWVGATFIPGANLQKVIKLVQDYDNHQRIYQPEVIRSKLLTRRDDFFKVYLRLRKTKLVTVVLDTEYDVTYHPLDEKHVRSRSISTKIVEVLDAGTAKETTLPPGRDHGFLWRLYTYWRFAEQEGGVYMECEAISLTRGIPTIVAPIIKPFIRELPREALERTLLGTRSALTLTP
jgi:hypothetical protein